MENEEIILPSDPEEDSAPQLEETAPETAEVPTEEAAENAAKEETTEEAAEDETTEEEDEAEDAAPPRRQNFRHTLRFFVFLLGFFLCALVLLCCAMSPLKRWLAELESFRPQYVEEEVYEMVFADPDWDLIYDLAGVKGTVFEGKDTFIAYMEAKTRGKELTCTQISDGLSGDRRFTLSADGEVIAAFTMTETAGDPLYPNWTLDSVEVFFTREESVTVLTHPNCTVYINGVALDESYVTATTHTAAEAYLPEGLHGDRTMLVQVDGLLCKPTIEVVDRSFTKLDVYYTADLDLYSTVIPTTSAITDEERAIVTEAAKTHALFDIRGCNISQLRKHFASNTPLYSQLTQAEPFCPSYKSHVLDEDSICVTDYYRYSDDLFSVRVSLSMEVTTKEKKTLDYTLDTTYFFTLHKSGVYLVTDSLDADLTETLQQVRLTYVHDGQPLLSQLVSTDAGSFPAPEVADGDGNAPTAWGVMGENGEIIPLLQVNEDGTCALIGDAITQPETLYPIFP